MISIFFFSSRRRHTRSKRDWSSDVCSSDLAARELDNGEIHSKDLVNAINKKSNNAKYIATFSEVESYLFNKVKPGDTIITMGAGDVYLIGESLLKEQENDEERTAV